MIETPSQMGLGTLVYFCAIALLAGWVLGRVWAVSDKKKMREAKIDETFENLADLMKGLRP